MNLSVTARYLFCSLYTLSENHIVFKKINFKNEFFLNLNNDDYFFINEENFLELYKSLNRKSLRILSYRLIRPLLNPRSLRFFYDVENNSVTKEMDSEIILLKNYLRKFKYNFRRSFFYQNGNYNNFPADKELNEFAIQLLFLLTGI